MGSLASPSCDLLLWNRGGGSADDLVGYVDLTGTPCEPYLPPSSLTPWWLEVTDHANGDVGYIGDSQVALSGSKRCVATNVPVNIPDNDGPVYSRVDCTTRIGAVGVGGVAQLPAISESAGAQADSPSSSAPTYAALAGACLLAVGAVAGGAWYARRRRVR